MSTTSRSVLLDGSVVQGHQHLCAFFHNKDQELRTLLPYIVDGLAAGEKAIHVVHANDRDDHRRRLAQAGIDVEGAEQRGQLDVIPGPSSYLQEGEFDHDLAIALIDRLLGEAREKGFPRTRFIGYMDWALELRASDLVLFEAHIDPILARHDDPVVCTYDLSRFNGSVVLDVMRTHPSVIVGGVVQHNPFYIPPEVMVREVRSREEGGSQSR
jgi:hypothetical protein